MSLIWAAIVSTILGLIIYAIISSNLDDRRKRKAREKALPFVDLPTLTGKRFDVQLADGRRFDNVEILGTTDPAEVQVPLGGWEGMLVLGQDDGRRVYVRQASVRCVVEL